MCTLLRNVGLSLVVVGTLGASGSPCFGGPLDPPFGPIGPTYKTLTEVEPRIAINATNTPGDANAVFVITAPGSYYLTGNLQGVSGKNGIEIRSGNVSLDLCGFVLLGVPGSLDGVSTEDTGRRALLVRNGSTSGWGRDGFNLGNASGSVFSDLVARGSGRGGMSSGSGNSVLRCEFVENPGYGLSCYISNTVTQCTAMANGGLGIRVQGGSVVQQCAARENGGDGIDATGGNGHVIDCNASSNGGDGIVAFYGSTVRDCTCDQNVGDGIEVGSDSRITSNTCALNGGAGIHANNDDNRIEGNMVSDNLQYGLLVDVGGNLIVKNSANNSPTNYSIAPGNSYGAIINVAGVGAFSTDQPWANFVY